MRILVTVLLTALFVFALATTWVDFVQPQLDKTAGATVQKESPMVEAAPVKKQARKVEPRPAPELPSPATEKAAETASIAAPARSSGEPASPLAPTLDGVKRQESDLAARQDALRLIQDDIRLELATVGEIRRQTIEDLAEAEHRSEAKHGALQVAQRTPPPTSRGPSSPPAPRIECGNPALRAEALVIRHLADHGKTRTAVSLLRSMKGRDAAGVLTELAVVDFKLADRLADIVHADAVYSAAAYTGTAYADAVRAETVDSARDAVRDGTVRR
jgi:hypothetical protein